jgi:hypothetical protein
MQTYILNKSGRQSVAIVGTEIASISNRDTSEATKTKWDTLRVIKLDPEWKTKQEEKTRTTLDPYWIGIAQCTLWPGEHNSYRILYAKTVEKVLAVVRMHLPAFDQSIADQLGIKNVPIREMEYEPGRSAVE